jgi:hypothetical protein
MLRKVARNHLQHLHLHVTQLPRVCHRLHAHDLLYIQPSHSLQMTLYSACTLILISHSGQWALIWNILSCRIYWGTQLQIREPPPQPRKLSTLPAGPPTRYPRHNMVNLRPWGPMGTERHIVNHNNCQYNPPTRCLVAP